MHREVETGLVSESDCEDQTEERRREQQAMIETCQDLGSMIFGKLLGGANQLRAEIEKARRSGLEIYGAPGIEIVG